MPANSVERSPEGYDGPDADKRGFAAKKASTELNTFASSAIAENAQGMPTAPVVALPSTLSMWSTGVRAKSELVFGSRLCQRTPLRDDGVAGI